ncbi:protein of unknown function (DUF2993) [Rubidibacter lacunae KORDI 51-2]|uniref:DUF2993 domain-containing protein n=1 Tax=Rubidibacter lacunae KORDI 51-2 TaxID=582515 RepID=U5DTX5_9CHRO|nr:LmeA family phospholipid-binding protein [Rubidibacter lacunae]ERN43125.1 protein of unknown function (DUF2993) [Rubidibacter lacunae KORDI 51-2]
MLDSYLLAPIASSALQLWVRSQLDRVTALEVEVVGGDRALLHGQVERVVLRATKAVYRGLQLGKADFAADRVRLEPSLFGRWMQPTAPVTIVGEVRLHSEDLRASLASLLLSRALTEICATALQVDGVCWTWVACDRAGLRLWGDRAGEPVAIQAGLHAIAPQVIWLSPLAVTVGQSRRVLPEGYRLTLGSEIALETLQLEAEGMRISGCVWIVPER